MTALCIKQSVFMVRLNIPFLHLGDLISHALIGCWFQGDMVLDKYLPFCIMLPATVLSYGLFPCLPTGCSLESQCHSEYLFAFTISSGGNFFIYLKAICQLCHNCLSIGSYLVGKYVFTQPFHFWYKVKFFKHSKASFPSTILVGLPRLKNPICSTIFSWLEREVLDLCLF